MFQFQFQFIGSLEILVAVFFAVTFFLKGKDVRILAQAILMFIFAIITFTFSEGIIFFYTLVLMVGLAMFFVALVLNFLSKKQVGNLDLEGFLMGGLLTAVMAYIAMALVATSATPSSYHCSRSAWTAARRSFLYLLVAACSVIQIYITV